MVRVVELPPAPALRPFVRTYSVRVADSGAPVTYVLAARPDLFVEFYLRDPYLVRDPTSGREEAAPVSVVVGPSTRRSVDLVVRGPVRVLTVHFEPAGMYRLFGVSPAEVVDAPAEAPLVLGAAVGALRERLAHAPTLMSALQQTDAFLLSRIAAARREHAIDRAAGILRQQSVPVARLADACGLSVRQFERVFGERVGLAPKRYARIARFDAARRLKARQPNLSWAAVAHDLGFADQMHLVRDFHALGGVAPSALLAGDERDDERLRVGSASAVAFVLGRNAGVV